MKHTILPRRYIRKIVMLGVIAALVFSCIPAKSALAFERVEYTQKRYKEIKKFKKIKTIYIFDKPVLKGTSIAIQKINKSLEREYKKSLKEKNTLQETAKGISKYTAKWKTPLYCTNKCKVTYNQQGIICFQYDREWYAGGVHNGMHYGLSFDLNTGHKLQLQDVLSGSTAKIKKRIWRQYKKEYPYFHQKKTIMKTPLSKWYFYLEQGNVIISSGAYAPGGGNGEMQITLRMKN